MVLAPALLENAYQSLDPAIDGEDIPYPTGRGRQVCKVVEGVYKREGGSAVQRPAVIEGGGDADRGLVCIGDAEVYLAHVCAALAQAPERRAVKFSMSPLGKLDGILAPDGQSDAASWLGGVLRSSLQSSHEDLLPLYCAALLEILGCS